MSDQDGLSVLMIGLDGACRSVMEPLFEAGSLPNLERVFDGGVTGALESQIPPWTPSAWPSMFTGVNPGKHGVFSFLDYDGYDWDVVNGSHVQSIPVWEHLSRHGFTSVVCNVPVTNAAREFDGALVPGYMAPESPDCHPAGLLDDLRDELGEYQIYPDSDDATGTDAATAYRSVIEMRGDAFRYLADRFEPDFGFVQFQQTDTVFHEHPGERETVQAVYEAVDEQVGRILADCDPDTVVVVSDHGIGEYDGYSFYLNEFLAEHGYTAVRQGGNGMPSWVPTRDEQLRDGDETSSSPGLLESATALAARYGMTTHRAGKLLETVGLRDFAGRCVPDRLVRASSRQVDFAASQAYMRARIECGVRINLEGREPDGVVPPERYEALRTELVEQLRGVETPDGTPMFEEVCRRERYFDGPNADRAVDIVTVPADFDHFLSAELAGHQFAAPGQPWNHKRDGVVAVAGDGVRGALSDAHLFDVTPTILALFGLPTSVEMDGNVLSCVEPTERRAYATQRDRSKRETDDGSIANRLTALGYLE
ncbi:alkaline phosphatase family protein [Haladaptatus caseinilyticus]|uniref:alkaline phosphatase family protein n=1 Tax=Haladaptatus caseinilyticus TaxID=2993314 RepID=UPI00224AC0DF|nr:alkaline phosphatase family protein [Haladaptatus caseinilyticus]